MNLPKILITKKKALISSPGNQSWNTLIKGIGNELVNAFLFGN